MIDILQRIDNHATVYPNRIAFHSRYGEITYKDLWEQSGELAWKIQSRRATDKSPVIVYGHKDPMMIVCFIACVRSGRAYCPLDLCMPAERVRFVAEQIGNPLVLCADKSIDTPDELECIDYEELCSIACNNKSGCGRAARLLSPCKGEDNFYIIFTSGTTGKPKGVQITVNNLNHYLTWSASLSGGIEPGAVFLNQAPYSFDLSVMDLYTSMAVGGTIIAVDKDLQSHLDEMIDYLAVHRIEYWVSTPSFANLCFCVPHFNQKLLPALKSFLFCGEVLPKETAIHLFDRFPDCSVINTYGPTESTVCVTQIEVTKEMLDADGPLPVGYAKPGTTIRIDPENGEILLFGDTVSPGYFKDPQRTSESFFAGSDNDRGYRTGDRGHLDETGMLWCEGRLDHQIKLNGYRIEIEDIEANLSRIPGVGHAAVSVQYAEGRAVGLTAFIVRDPDHIQDDYSGRKYVRDQLRDAVPDYMVPKRIVFVSALPVTSNGKLDRKMLGEMA